MSRPACSRRLIVSPLSHHFSKSGKCPYRVVCASLSLCVGIYRMGSVARGPLSVRWSVCPCACCLSFIPRRQKIGDGAPRKVRHTAQHTQHTGLAHTERVAVSVHSMLHSHKLPRLCSLTRPRRAHALSDVLPPELRDLRRVPRRQLRHVLLVSSVQHTSAPLQLLPVCLRR